MTADQSQQLLQQAQIYQQQMQGIAVQKETLHLQLAEISSALDELDKTKETDVYKISGPLLIKTEKSDVKKDLEEKKELIDVKVKTLEKSEQKIKVKIDELRERLTKSGMGS